MPKQDSSPKLIPVNQLRSVSGEASEKWESTGNDPEFRLEGVPAGLVKVSFVASSDVPVDFVLYAYGADGLLKEEINIGVVSEKEKPYSAIVQIDVGARLLRLDPGKLPARFVIKSVKLKRMTGLRFMLRASLNFLSDKNNISLRAMSGALSGALWLLREGGRRRLRDHAVQRVKETAGIHKFNYSLWVQQHTPGREELQKMAQQSITMPLKPTFSILLLRADAEEYCTKRCFESILAQVYPYW